MFEALEARIAGLDPYSIRTLELAFFTVAARFDQLDWDDLRLLNALVRCVGVAEFRLRNEPLDRVKAIADEAAGHFMVAETMGLFMAATQYSV